MTNQPTLQFPVDHVLAAFAQGDIATLLAYIAEDLLVVLQRLAVEVFPKGTQILHTHSTPLGNHWVLTQFHQRFFYAVQERAVESLTWIVSHSQDGLLDYFRETVTTINPLGTETS